MLAEYIITPSFQVRLYQEDAHKPDYVNMCQCLIHLDRPSQIATILDSLVRDDALKTSVMVSCSYIV